MGHIKKQRDPGVNLINILSARTAAPRGLENQLILTNRNVLCYLNHRLFDSSISNADETIKNFLFALAQKFRGSI